MKTADYTFFSGPVRVEYDETAPCIVCKLPVVDASMGGTAVCPACDCGVHRDNGDHWTIQETVLIFRDKLTPQEARETLKCVGVMTLAAREKLK